MALVVNGRAYDMLDDKKLFNDVLEHTAKLPFDRQDRSAAVRTLAKCVLGSPSLTRRGAAWLLRKLWHARGDLLRARGRVDKLTFFIHDFMDACSLEKERIDACVFTTATSEGPISMCLHNAKRDSFVLQPVRLGDGNGFWNPLSNAITAQPDPVPQAIQLHRKAAKGRRKPARNDRRRAGCG